MTAPQKLNELLSYFTPSPAQFDAARSHRDSIAARLEQHPGTFGMFETGSLTHGTGISIYSDVDFFASMKGTRPTPSTALAKVRDSLKARFTTTEVRVSSPAVVGTISLTVYPAVSFSSFQRPGIGR
ncbi:SMODS domain-containing nucleotidyltransferase [Zafaria sp. Z1313]|uniref:SMODS domain-containing nucleotidyltransferase n=1 Tax=Zafaria sp. Z1313 TaxID=3423202 RepID=UPI003D303C21